jgi:hypothetical protein
MGCARENVVPDPGFQSVEEIKQVIEILEGDLTLSDADLERIEGIRAEVGTRFCRRCDYCMPCPQRIDTERDVLACSVQRVARQLHPPVGIHREGHGERRELRRLWRVRGEVPVRASHQGDDAGEHRVPQEVSGGEKVKLGFQLPYFDWLGSPQNTGPNLAHKLYQTCTGENLQ